MHVMLPLAKGHLCNIDSIVWHREYCYTPTLYCNQLTVMLSLYNLCFSDPCERLEGGRLEHGSFDTETAWGQRKASSVRGHRGTTGLVVSLGQVRTNLLCSVTKKKKKEKQYLPTQTLLKMYRGPTAHPCGSCWEPIVTCRNRHWPPTRMSTGSRRYLRQWEVSAAWA